MRMRGMGLPTFLLILTTTALLVNAQSDTELENVLEKIFYPQDQSSIHAQALRRDLMRRLYDSLQNEELEDELMDYKRSINSLARWGNLPTKRNLEALARAGYIKTASEDDVNDKRSIATLAKNGQLPTHDESKRGIEALARNGELHSKRDIQELIDELYNKRNIGSLARSYSFPSYGKRYLGSLARSGGYNRFLGVKRNVASLAREGGRYIGKRNVAALLRQDKIHGPNDRSYDETMEKSDEGVEMDDEKRNIASLKASGFRPFKRSIPDAKLRPKRNADYFEMNDEYASPVYQNQNVFDYEELMKALTGEYPNTDKRFLGSVARSGWFRQSTSSMMPRIDKRHIGSLARLGWLPSFRSVRRVNRSGRSVNKCDRENTADGEAEEYPFSKNQISIGDKRFLLQPAVDKILLKKVLMQARNQ